MEMKLQKRFNRKVGNKKYDKWVVTIPPEKVEHLGWRDGTDLEIDVKDDKLILKPKNV
jgi:antitoxin component of MazEF toxin-antitoxin module